jgi:hypothetical protein
MLALPSPSEVGLRQGWLLILEQRAVSPVSKAVDRSAGGLGSLMVICLHP